MRSSFAAYWRALANGTRKGPLDRLLLALLVPLSLPYALVQHLRALLYRSGIIRAKKLPRPVISIGNLTVGGTGKTPVTAHIARLLLAQGFKVAVLSRGYGGTCEGRPAIVSDGRTITMTAGECGDEPRLLASTVPGLMVVIGSDRHSAGQLAMEHLAPDLFLLDDGFQHMRLERDLNILLLDCNLPFGNGWTLPAGLLREPASAAARADLVIFTRCLPGQTTVPFAPVVTVCRARHELGGAVPLMGGETMPLTALAGRKVLAFAGIAEPQAFFDGLRQLGLDLVSTLPLPDHVDYNDARTAEIEESMRRSGAEIALTTGKDGVKLERLPRELARRILIAPLDLIIDDPTPLLAMLSNLLQK
ncbi:tetraacyldisaccharide 4'-kinase [Geobacter sp. SVR]|uniref:tetraacyldisaccharide 4'-kinase n=1 Tax=Geobacter sp. SVR TaxID=2495594 RepID=UPI00143F029F|nr:tetraacyldisaccharide 4'-kinase [Geobacter sp. SVR]BCS52424.1 tetraacyldisaccharide 4'-kinase [Geobacter sp. SVR]GCF87345.1 tetraacyldisaccharide 4'-kinase [Geobacter sp. SVR]